LKLYLHSPYTPSWFVRGTSRPALQAVRSTICSLSGCALFFVTVSWTAKFSGRNVGLLYTTCVSRFSLQFLSATYLICDELSEIPYTYVRVKAKFLQWRLEKVRSQTQLCQLRCFNGYTRQLHVSAPTGHLQVVFKST